VIHRHHRMTRRIVAILTVALAVGAGAGPRPHAEAAESTAKEPELLAVLRSEAPEAEKAITCKYLAVHGSAAAVPDLVKLLGDPRLASWARIPLEVIPGPEADSALRAAAGALDGRLLAGVINSIGVRGDVAAVPMLAGRLADGDAEVAAAAAGALGRIGTPAAAAALGTALGQAADPDELAQACVVCAEKLLAAGDTAGAIALGNAVRKANVSEQRRAEASRAVILASGADGIPQLVELLRSPSRRLFNMGLFAARELGIARRAGPLAGAVDRTLMEEVTRLRGADEARGAMVIAALADRGGAGESASASAAPIRVAMIESAQAGPRTMRLAAVAALGRVGDTSVVGPLLDVAKDAGYAAAVRQALATLVDPAADAEIRGRLDGADEAVLPMLVGLVGDRRIDAAAQIVPLVDHRSAEVRSAALGALGAIVDLANLDVLIRAIDAPGSGDVPDVERAIATKALTEASVRMEDREACAAKLAAALAAAGPAQQIVLLDTLGEVGGTRALQTLAAAAASADEAQQDAATRLLGKWMTADAAPVLLGLSQPDAPPRFRTRALRGYLRIARQFVLPDMERAAMCRRALAAATEEVDRKAILEILKRYPGPATLEVAREAVKVPGLEAEAAAVAREIEQKITKPAT
jgi:HEAT repeat protein